jgi:DNA-binding PadR family transcriptional regulator
MARLEDAKFVTGEYREKIVEGQRINERIYTLTGEGAKALRDTTQFYNALSARHGLA